MVNKNYIKGRRFEYETVNSEREEGCLAFRSAGSHSPIDVVSISRGDKTIRFIQCKSGKTSHKGLKKEFEGTEQYTVIWEVREKITKKK